MANNLINNSRVKVKVKKGAKSVSSRRWLERQLNDPYVIAAKNDGYRSRSAYKLIEINEKYNPNGSSKNIAGIFNKEKNILGMMPHPERMIDSYLSGEDGSIFFENLVNNLKK